MLPPDLSLFLGEEKPKEWEDTPSSSVVLLKSSRLSVSKDSQCHPTYTGGAQPKEPTRPSAGQSQTHPEAARGPDPVNHHCQLIQAKMWRAGILTSGRRASG